MTLKKHIKKLANKKTSSQNPEVSDTLNRSEPPTGTSSFLPQVPTTRRLDNP